MVDEIQSPGQTLNPTQLSEGGPSVDLRKGHYPKESCQDALYLTPYLVIPPISNQLARYNRTFLPL